MRKRLIAKFVILLYRSDGNAESDQIDEAFHDDPAFEFCMHRAKIDGTDEKHDCLVVTVYQVLNAKLSNKEWLKNLLRKLQSIAVTLHKCNGAFSLN